MQTPDYPFFTRYGTFQLTAWLSESVTCDVLMPVSYYPAAHINWTRQNYVNRQPNWSDGEIAEVLITRAEFIAAYQAADAFLVQAETEFLQAAPVVYATAAQVAELQRLVENPLLDRRTKARTLLALPKLTTKEAAALINVLHIQIGTLALNAA